MKKAFLLAYTFLALSGLLCGLPSQTVDPGFNYGWNRSSDEQRKENLEAHKFLQKASPTENGCKIEFRKIHYASIPYFVYFSHDLQEWNHLGTVTPWGTFLLNAESNITLESYENKTVFIPPFRNPPTTRSNAVIEVSWTGEEKGLFFVVVNSVQPYTATDYSNDRTEDHIEPTPME